MWHPDSTSTIGGFLTLVISLVPAVGSAQQQINNQVNNSNPPRNPYNPETLHYAPQIGFLPSEELFAYQRSGMTPSELRMKIAAEGPLAPQGSLNYIEPQSRLQQQLRLPPPVLYNPFYVHPLPPNANAPQPPPPLPSTVNANRTIAGSAPANIGPAPRNLSVSGQLPPIVNEESTVTYRIPSRSPASNASPQPHAPETPAPQPAATPPATQPIGSGQSTR